MVNFRARSGARLTLLDSVWTMSIVEFDWDEANRQHIARHGVLPHEAEEALTLDPLEVDVQRHQIEARILCFGRTKSGRLLTILYAERGRKVRVVTAYEMTKAQQRLYFQGK